MLIFQLLRMGHLSMSCALKLFERIYEQRYPHRLHLVRNDLSFGDLGEFGGGFRLLPKMIHGRREIGIIASQDFAVKIPTAELQPIFNYISGIKYPSWFAPELPRGCDCVGGCVDPTICLCAARNGGDFPYNQAGFLIQTKPVVYECGSSCRCSSSCYNRVSQRGLKYQLEIFKTKKKSSVQ